MLEPGSSELFPVWTHTKVGQLYEADFGHRGTVMLEQIRAFLQKSDKELYTWKYI